MSLVDPISDVLTKIRNASRAKHETVDVPASRFAAQILERLKQEGFIKNFKESGAPPKRLYRVYLKYSADRARVPAITNLIRISRPGLRQYRGAKTLPRVLNGLGVGIVTTSKGVLTDHEARKQQIGGEVVCYVW